MSEERPSVDPVSTLSLDYFRPRDDGLRSIVRAAAWLAILYAGAPLLAYLIAMTGYLYQAWTGQPSKLFTIPGIPSLIGAPAALAEVGLVGGAICILGCSPAGRRWCSASALALVIVLPPTYLIEVVYSWSKSTKSYSYGGLDLAMYWGQYAIRLIGEWIVPFFLWKFFRWNAVRDVLGMAINSDKEQP